MALRFKLILAVFFAFYLSNAQDTIKTEKLIIVKQYSPTVNDAFKVKQKPDESNKLEIQSKSVDYKFISIPVASTFTPAKGRASGVILPPKPRFFNSYARLGFGNFTTGLGELYSNFLIDRQKSISLDFSHLSSQGGIEDVLVDDHYFNTNFDVGLHSTERNLKWNVGINLNHDIYNWYGIQLPTNYSIVDDVTQTYLGLGLNGGIDFYNKWIKSAKINYYNFSDDFNSAENFIDLNFNSELLLGYEQALDVSLNLNYLTTTYDESINVSDYSFYNVSILPRTQFKVAGIEIDAGAKVVLNANVEQSETNFFIYPKISANYNITETLNVFTAIDGDLTQNTYRDFTSENPFVSPDLKISPTNKMYDASLGLQSKFGKLTAVAKIGYADFDNTYFFKHNYEAPSIATVSLEPNNAYSQNNSFKVVYDDMTQFNAGLSFNYTPDEDLDLGLDVNYFVYNTEYEVEAWNLPELEAKIYGHYNFTDRWRFGMTAFFVGERQAFNGTNTSIVSGNQQTSTQSLESFVDLNFALDYAITKRFSVFVNGNNLLSADQPRWKAYQVQGIQVLGGLTYKFDW
ncbi:TonB-dependent receptor [Psychroflexus sp. ALD_RP9]|uniref:TonB-dependent receptor n=1 Tax=Psychroflexus sp. ALD_RP9 TaxID=2777186 RepID=UPI001A8D99F7|nr:TonB-dependent receptor [Psychroflexus sp. ALD_RP9]QSS97273.1 TonB-dependent receptor [Psychroflexus sp. ALD_RP9]